jgi:enoyl-CoA hydratase/carnithine racemase
LGANHLRIETDKHIAVMVVNRPHKLNALSDDLIRELTYQFDRFAADQTIRAVILRGAGEKAFCSGYDLGALAAKKIQEDAHAQSIQHPLEPVVQAMANYPFPVIGMLNGNAFGAGCELAVCCDIRIAADDIRMGMPPAKIGVVYPWTGLQRFIQAIGWNHTREMFFTGDVVEGPRLRAIGLVNHLIRRSQLEAFTYAMANRIAENAPLSIRGIKKTLNLISCSAMALTPEQETKAKAAALKALNSKDLVEGQAALKEKRKPLFKGR